MFSGGRSETTGAPAASVSPGWANTSAMRPPMGAVTLRCASRHSAIASPAAQRSDRGALRLDLALPAQRQQGLIERGRGGLHLGLGRTVIGAALIDGLRRGVSVAQQRLVAGQIGASPHQGRAGICQIGFRLRDFRRLAAGFEIGELLFALGELARRLVAGGPFVGVVLPEERRALGDQLAARHEQLGQQPLLDRGDLDVVGVGIALPDDRFDRAVLRPPQPENSPADDGEDDDQKPRLPHHAH